MIEFTMENSDAEIFTRYINTLDQRDFNNLSEEILKQNISMLDWEKVSNRTNLSDEFIFEFREKLDLSIIFRNAKHYKISEQLIRDLEKLGFLDDIHIWFDISQFYWLSEEFLRDYQDKIYWPFVCQYYNFSQEFIIEFSNKIEVVSLVTHLSEEFIKDIKDKIDWGSVISLQDVTIDFIKKFREDISWHGWKTVTEKFYKENLIDDNFIKEFQDKLDWKFLTGFYQFTEEFLIEFKDKIVWDTFIERVCEEKVYLYHNGSTVYEYPKFEKISKENLLKLIDRKHINCKNYHLFYNYMKPREFYKKCSIHAIKKSMNDFFDNEWFIKILIVFPIWVGLAIVAWPITLFIIIVKVGYFLLELLLNRRI